MNKLEEYLAQPGLKRLWPKVKTKYLSLDRIGGKVQLRQLSLLEQEALGGLLAKNLLGKKECVVELTALDQVLKRSRFAVGLVEALECLYGPSLLTKREQAQAAEKEWLAFFATVEQVPQQLPTRSWLTALRNGQGQGYRTFLTLYHQDKGQASNILRTCLQALDRLPCWRKHRTRLPVFAAGLTGDPHALDSNTALGRLFFQGVLFTLEIESDASSAEKKREILSQAGLEGDDVSSTVIVAGLCTLPSDPRAGIFSASRSTHTPILLPLRFFDRPTLWTSMPIVYVMENPTVFSAILDATGNDFLPPLVCTSGQLSVAALKLLDELTVAGNTLYYSGDFDPDGLQIGIRLQERYGNAFHPWFFDCEAYHAAPAGLALTFEQQQTIRNLTVSWDKTLSTVILERGSVVYQESLVDKMIASFLQH